MVRKRRTYLKLKPVLGSQVQVKRDASKNEVRSICNRALDYRKEWNCQNILGSQHQFGFASNGLHKNSVYDSVNEPKKDKEQIPKNFHKSQIFFSVNSWNPRSDLSWEWDLFMFILLSVADCRVSLGSLLSSELSVTVGSGRRIYRWVRMPRTITLDS